MKTKIILIIALVISIFSITVSCQSSEITQKEEEKKFAVATDIHVYANSLLDDSTIEYYQSVDKMIHLSEPIFNTMADEIINNKYKFFLLAGDLTENGDEASHRAVAKTLKRMEESGVEVYVINGNHDVRSTEDKRRIAVTQSQFSEIYADFGYSEADSVLPGTLCYSLPIMNKFRLIAVDNIQYYVNDDSTSMIPELTIEKKGWIYEMTQKAREENMIPIVLAHKPFINHWPRAKAYFSSESTDYKNIAYELPHKGTYISFVGHSHFNDISVLNGMYQEDYYEIMTGSTCFYETNYRSIMYSDEKIDITTNTITEINTDYISAYVSDSIVNAVKTDFPAYAKEHFKKGIKSVAIKYLNKLLNKFSFIGSGVIDILKNTIITELLDIRLYKANSAGKVSLEEILNQYDIELASTEYETVWDLVPQLLITLIHGNEDLENSVELDIITYTFYGMAYLIDKYSDMFNALVPNSQYYIDLDLEQLFKEGILECYDSNLMPTLLTIIKNNSNSKITNYVVAALATDFSSIEIASEFISALTNGLVSGIDKYFYDTEIDVRGLVREKILGDLLSDLIKDTEPNDREYSITFKQYE